MKAHSLKLATVALALCAIAIVLPAVAPDFAAGLYHAAGGAGGPVMALVSLVALRAQHKDLTDKATAKRAEITDGMPKADVTRIEGEHEALVRQAADVQRQIAEAEAEEQRQQQNQPPGNTAPNADAAARAASEAAIAAERTRVSEIRTIARQGNVEGEPLDTAIANGTTADAFRRTVLDLVARRSQENTGTGVRVELTRDEVDTRRRGMTEAIVARMARASGERNIQIPEVARKWGEMGLIEIAAECIDHRGLLRTARQADDMLQRAMMTTSDFPAILMDAMNRRLLARYQASAPTYRLWAARYVNPDFRDTNVIRAGDFPALQPVNEHGEIKSGAFSESKEKLRVSPYGVMLSFTRVMIINDQLGAIDQVLSSAGVRVTDWENSKAYEVLLSQSGVGPDLITDETPVFDADHGNLASSGTAIDVTNVGKGRAAMRKQTTLDGIKANFMPVTLLSGPDKETEAEQLLTAITPATNATAVPASLRKLMPVADANITGNPWYLFADPAVAPCFHYGYLEGYEGPRMTSQERFTVQGMSVKLEHDFGVAATDFRGGYRNPGA